MVTFSHYLDEIKKSPEKINEFHDVLKDIFCDLKENCHKHYEKYMYDVHKLLYGCHFNEYLACKAVDQMENADGTKGAHWQFHDTTRFANEFGLNEYDFYYVINMIYSDFSCVINSSDINIYAKLARAYIEDKDAPEGKAFKLYIAGKK